MYNKQLLNRMMVLTLHTTPHGTEERVFGPTLTSYGARLIPEQGYYLYVDAPDGSQVTTCFACHLDGATKEDTMVTHTFDGRYLGVEKGPILGADDKSGLCVLLHLIEAKVPGHYLFFFGEEVGGIGSGKFADDEVSRALLDGVQRMVCFDRRGTSEIITRQSRGVCCSDEFAADLSHKLAAEGLFLYPSTGGTFTDCANFIEYIPECTNIAVGYFNAHGTTEKQDMLYLERLIQAAIAIPWETLVTKRVPEAPRAYSYGGQYGGGGYYSGFTKKKKNTAEIKKSKNKAKRAVKERFKGDKQGLRQFFNDHYFNVYTGDYMPRTKYNRSRKTTLGTSVSGRIWVGMDLFEDIVDAVDTIEDALHFMNVGSLEELEFSKRQISGYDLVYEWLWLSGAHVSHDYTDVSSKDCWLQIDQDVLTEVFSMADDLEQAMLTMEEELEAEEEKQQHQHPLANTDEDDADMALDVGYIDFSKGSAFNDAFEVVSLMRLLDKMDPNSSLRHDYGFTWPMVDLANDLMTHVAECIKDHTSVFATAMRSGSPELLTKLANACKSIQKMGLIHYKNAVGAKRAAAEESQTNVLPLYPDDDEARMAAEADMAQDPDAVVDDGTVQEPVTYYDIESLRYIAQWVRVMAMLPRDLIEAWFAVMWAVEDSTHMSAKEDVRVVGVTREEIERLITVAQEIEQEYYASYDAASFS